MSKKRLTLYPDFGSDLEFYDFNTVRFVIAVLGAVILLGTSVFSDMIPGWVSVSLYAIGDLCIGIFCIRNLVYCVGRGRILCETLPVMAACIALFCTGQYILPAVLLACYEAVKLYENYIQRREHTRAENVLNILPRLANVVYPGKKLIHKKPLHLKKGDVVLVREGETVPIDGYVMDGMTAVDYSAVTGGKFTDAVMKGSKVVSGGINRGNSILVRATCDYNSSAARKIYSSFTSSVNRQSGYTVRCTEIYNLLYPVMIALALIFGAVIPIFTHGWVTGIRKAAAIVLCACPAGIVNILDICVFAGVRRIFASGAVIRDGRILDTLSRMETFVCNKTGTVTQNTYRVAEIMPAGYSSEDPCGPDDPMADELLYYAAGAESLSKHPIAAAIREFCGSQTFGQTEDSSSEEFSFEEIPGKGISAMIHGDTVLCGNASLLFENGVNCSVPNTQGAAVHVAVNGRYLGYFVLINELRAGNYDALEKLRSCGVENFSLLSCDLRSVVRPIAASLSFSNVRTELTPEGKVGAVEYLMNNRTRGRSLAFLGNGSDELAAASRAEVSAASDALFNEDAWNSSDIAVFSEGISVFPLVVGAAYDSMKISKYAMAVNLAIRIAAVILAMIGIVPAAFSGIVVFLASAVSLFFAGRI